MGEDSMERCPPLEGSTADSEDPDPGSRVAREAAPGGSPTVLLQSGRGLPRPVMVGGPATEPPVGGPATEPPNSRTVSPHTSGISELARFGNLINLHIFAS